MTEDASPTAFDLTLNATDADAGDTLTWSISTPASNGTASASGTGTSKVIAYTPAADYNGSNSFVVQVTDGTATDTITVNVTITAVNDAPVITAQASTLSTLEDTNITILLTDVIFSDVDNTSGFSLEVQPGSLYTFSGNTVIPDTQYNGSLTVPVKVSDGSASSDVFNLHVTVSAVNDPPNFMGLTSPDRGRECADWNNSRASIFH